MHVPTGVRVTEASPQDMLSCLGQLGGAIVTILKEQRGTQFPRAILSVGSRSRDQKSGCQPLAGEQKVTFPRKEEGEEGGDPERLDSDTPY